MQHRFLIATGLALMLKGNAMAQERILISSEWGNVTAELVDNDATRSLVRMLPLTISMSDHLRQEKTGDLPSPLPAVARQQDFSAGTLGLWSSGRLRHLLSRRPCAPAWHRYSRPCDRRCLDL